MQKGEKAVLVKLKNRNSGKIITRGGGEGGSGFQTNL
jgi:hypothetical protein